MSSEDGKKDLSASLVQIVDDGGEFLPKEALKVSKHFLSRGFDYYVVAILGCQSSGKSTMLNLLFGTSFPVMEAAEGRTQTTQGVWMGEGKAKSEKEESILVFDVEGTDSRERGENAAAFERKTSLFSLALAEVLIVNMWHTDIGRYSAGNIALLKIVFELNLQLFQKQSGPKTLLLFLIRDHVPRETPLEKLKGIILKDMSNIWEGLIKPEQFKSSNVEDFFTFSFVALPHKVLAEEQFYQEVAVLRNRFVNASAPDFIVTQEYRKDIPSDGFLTYAEHIWETVKQNKDLDIPTQKEMLAMYRCDEISAEAFKNFSSIVTPWKKTVEGGGLVEEFGKKAAEASKAALAEYDIPAVRYHAEVAARKREVLASKLNDDLYSLFSKQLQRIAEKALSFFENLLEEALPSDGSAVSEFANLKNSLVSSTFEYFQQRATASVLPESDWSFEQEFKDFEKGIQKQIAVVRQNQLEKLMKEMKTLFINTTVKPLDKVLENPTEDMWPKIRQLYGSGKQKASDKLKERLAGFEINEEETTAKLEELQMVAFDGLKDRFKEKAKLLDYFMTKKFSVVFNLDEQGLPRRWKQTDDIPKIFLEARQKSEGLLEKFCLLRLTPELDSVDYLNVETESTDIEPSVIVLSFEEAQIIKEKFHKETESIYLQALRDQENVTSASHIPMYVIVLILVLGFDEFIHVISNPLLALFLIILGGMFYVIYLLNLVGPVRTMVETLMHTSLSGVQAYLSQQINAHKGVEVNPQKKDQ